MFLIYCDNKGCGKDQEPLLDVLTNEVHCVECGKTISSVTSFAKAQMKSLGQVKRNDNKGQAFAVKCSSCKKEAPPTVIGEKIHCSICKIEMKDISAPFVQMIKMNTKAQKA